MTAEAQSISKPKGGGPPKRRLRNFLLDTKFQLKYTGMVVFVTVLVTGAVGYWLGSEAYSYSKGMSQMLLMQQEGAMEVDDELHQLFVEEANERDTEVLSQIVLGIGSLVVILSLALGFTGIIVTHKVVGPAYKLKLLLGDVAKGTLDVRGGLRKGDELQDVGDAFSSMVRALRERRQDELDHLDAAIAKLEADRGEAEASYRGEPGDEPAGLSELRALRDRLAAVLDT